MTAMVRQAKKIEHKQVSHEESSVEGEATAVNLPFIASTEPIQQDTARVSDESSAEEDQSSQRESPPSKPSPAIQPNHANTAAPAAPDNAPNGAAENPGAPVAKASREVASPPKRSKPKTGVVYLSRIPPGMDLGALRALLGRTGRLGRVWLRRESAEARRERTSLGSTRGRSEFRDGWVEFKQQRDARKAVGLLNGRPMTGAKRRGRWADDLWCMKLLRGFEWNDLVDETAGGARERVLKVRAEVAAARRERAFLEERVALANKLERKGEEGEPRRRRVVGQKRAIERAWEEDVDERRAREAMERVDAGGKGGLDKELVGMLFKKRKSGNGEGER